jgi:hypothetical protein
MSDIEQLIHCVHWQKDSIAVWSNGVFLTKKDLKRLDTKYRGYVCVALFSLAQWIFRHRNEFYVLTFLSVIANLFLYTFCLLRRRSPFPASYISLPLYV